MINRLIVDLEGLPFDVIQIDDGWQIGLGEWEANKKFPSGMAAIADKIHATGRKAGIWLAPFVVPRKSKLAFQHPDWLLRNENGLSVFAGVGWSGDLLALDSSHPEVLEWIAKTIDKMLTWRFDYLKLDFLYAAAMPGVYKGGIPREIAYRNAMHLIRKVAGEETYILACGAPIIPSLGICDAIRTGPDVAPFWQSKPMSVWLNNPSHPGTQNGIRASLNRLWLKGLVHVDPDVAYFRSRNNHLSSKQSLFLKDIVRMSGFKSTSDLPQWLKQKEKNSLIEFMNETCSIEQLDRYIYRINDRIVDFSSIIILPKAYQFPPWIGLFIGMLQMGFYELLPGLLESLRVKMKHQVTSFFTNILSR